MPNSVKSVKLPRALHKEIKAESVEGDENIEAVLERAWRAYKSMTTKGQSAIIKTDDQRLPLKESEIPYTLGLSAGLQSDHPVTADAPRLEAAIAALQSSGRIAALDALTAFATFLVDYDEPGRVAPPHPGQSETDLDKALRGRSTIEDAAKRHSIVPPHPARNAPRVRGKKGGTEEKAG